MKAIKIISTMLLATFAVVGCLPAEEQIEDTGVASFVAAFETVKDAKALWQEDDKVVVIDSRNESYRFALDFGQGSADGEFSGDISPKSTIKFVAYSADDSQFKYLPAEGKFSMYVDSVYKPQSAGTLLTTNNAAVGILQGSQVELKTLCGFIKLTVESNGQTFYQDGNFLDLTDIKRISLKSGDGKCFAGKVNSRWNETDRIPEFIDVEDGCDSITFNTRILSSAQGDIYYEAGDYWIPVAPQLFENVTITLEDTEGHLASLPKRSIDVKRALSSTPGSVEWPTVVISANFLCSSAQESQQHEVWSFSSENLMCDRVSKTTGETVAGKSKKNTVVDFTHQGIAYQLFATNGFGRSSNTSSCLQALMFNTYTAEWSYSSDKWTVGSPNGYAWVKIPAHGGILTKIELTINSKEGNPVNISSSVDALTGKGSADIVAPTATKAAQSQYTTLTFIPTNTKPGIPYYICVGNGHTYRIQAWKFYYKEFNN